MHARPAAPREGPGGSSPSPGEQLPPAAEIDERGVDLSLVREALGRSPAERLDATDACAQEIEALRRLVHGGPAQP